MYGPLNPGLCPGWEYIRVPECKCYTWIQATDAHLVSKSNQYTFSKELIRNVRLCSLLVGAN